MEAPAAAPTELGRAGIRILARLARVAERACQETGISLPQVRRGDVLAVGSSGAYGVSASPTRFISHPEPKEILVIGMGPEAELQDVTSTDRVEESEKQFAQGQPAPSSSAPAPCEQP